MAAENVSSMLARRVIGEYVAGGLDRKQTFRWSCQPRRSMVPTSHSTIGHSSCAPHSLLWYCRAPNFFCLRSNLPVLSERPSKNGSRLAREVGPFRRESSNQAALIL